MGVKRLAPGGNLVVGAESDADFVVTAEGLTANHELVSQTENGAQIKPGPGMTLTVNGQEKSGNIQLEKDEEAVVTLGALELQSVIPTRSHRFWVTSPRRGTRCTQRCWRLPLFYRRQS